MELTGVVKEKVCDFETQAKGPILTTRYQNEDEVVKV
jgi:hypothetical protein